MLQKMDAISRRVSGKDLSRQLSSVDEGHKRQLMSEVGLSSSVSLCRQSSSRPITPGGKQPSLAPLQPSKSAPQRRELGNLEEKREVSTQQIDNHDPQERAREGDHEVHIAYI